MASVNGRCCVVPGPPDLDGLWPRGHRSRHRVALTHFENAVDVARGNLATVPETWTRASGKRLARSEPGRQRHPASRGRGAETGYGQGGRLMNPWGAPGGRVMRGKRAGLVLRHLGDWRPKRAAEPSHPASRGLATETGRGVCRASSSGISGTGDQRSKGLLPPSLNRGGAAPSSSPRVPRRSPLPSVSWSGCGLACWPGAVAACLSGLFEERPEVAGGVALS